jgi:hypothetical protein
LDIARDRVAPSSSVAIALAKADELMIGLTSSRTQ